MVKPWLHTTLNHLAWTSREGSMVNFDDSATAHPYFGAFTLDNDSKRQQILSSSKNNRKEGHANAK